MRLNLSRLHFPVSALGPGNRIGIWFQGCSIRCPGCISVDTWEPSRGETTVDAALSQIVEWLPQADGVTISGGEPFDQIEALHALLSSIRQRFVGDILVYSGYSRNKLQITKFESLIDALIVEPFDNSAPQTLALRGSDNQTILLLTDLGRRRFAAYDRASQDSDKTLDVMFDSESGVFWLAGIPRRGDLLALRNLLGQYGHKITTSEYKNSADEHSRY